MGKDETMRARDKTMLENAVKRGVAYLDANPDREEAFVDWWRKIEVNYLNLASGAYCIIGQTMGDYSRLIDIDDFDSKPNGWLSRWAARHGFVVRDRTLRKNGYMLYGEWHYPSDVQWRDEAYAYLTVLWADEVERRQLASSLSDSLTELSQA